MSKLQKILVVSAGILLFVTGGGLYWSQADWVPITGNEHNMVYYGIVHHNSADFSTGKYLLYSFGPIGENDCRSKSEIRKDGSFYATILGNVDGENISFKIYDSESGEIYDLADTVFFQFDDTKSDVDIY